MKEVLSKVGTAELAALISVAVALLSFLGQLRSFLVVSRAEFRALDERAKALTFWQAWLQTQTTVCAPEQLESAKAVVRSQLARLAEDPPPTSSPPGSPTMELRRALLLHPPRRAAIWFARAPFFLAMPIALYLSFELFEPIANGTATTTMKVTFFAILAVMTLLILALRLGALLLDGDLAPIPASQSRTQERTA